jgi:hypothetical protein
MRRSKAFVALTSAVAALAVLYACTGDDSNPTSPTPPPTTTPQDSGGTPFTPADTGPGTPTNDATPPPVDSGPQPTCFSGTPQNYLDIINACTDAQAIDKQVDLSPMNLPDGGLQPLP